ncbi:hypothetical protein NCG97_37145 [Streptomyces lydicamycinicus]|nr:hypothetical protein [Streptomyces lydicamycinicus]USA04997.1 hypothetical protein NCG97_37145 [Streptomyces lydicamycinicus]
MGVDQVLEGVGLGGLEYGAYLLSQSIAMAITVALKKKLNTLYVATRQRVEVLVTVTSETANEVPMVKKK